MNQITELMGFMGQPLAMDQLGLRAFIASTVQTAKSHQVREEEKKPVAMLFSAGGNQHELREPGDSVPNGQFVAAVPLSGPLSMHGGFASFSTHRFTKTIEALDRSSSVSGIVVAVNSPGGTVTGTSEAASALRGVRERGATATASVSNPMMASAATWIGTSASKVYVTPSGSVGSIGVISWYEDLSAMLEEFGVKIDVMRTPEKKARFTGVEPLTDDMRETMQARNQLAYSQFVDAMARNRGVDREVVEGAFGGGEMMESGEALEAGLVDGVATLDDVVSSMASQLSRKQANRNRLSLAGA